MNRTDQQLRDDALRIWHVGVAAVRPERLIPDVVAVEGENLLFELEDFPIFAGGRIVVVGAGKAAAAVAVALEQTLGKAFLRKHRATGWVNVPADCIEPAQFVHLHATRPPGVNEPTQKAIDGTAEILRLVGSLGPADLCICLVSGGGSALLVQPIKGITLADKAELTREIAARGGTIDQLNAVRRELSRVKGGGLARACHAGRLVSLILSDVPGDDLATIASGPTVLCRPEPARAIEVIEQLQLEATPAGRTAINVLGRLESKNASPPPPTCRVTNILLGNNATAVDAAGIEAERLGYSHAMISATKSEGPAEEVGRWLVAQGRSMQTTGEPDCLISGGETTVELVPPSERGLGGRNQQAALAAVAVGGDWRGMALVSGGTDGEDGPTDATGAIVDAQVVRRARELGLDPTEFLRRNDAYHFFEQTGGLFKTGPTHTNVSDLRVLTIVARG